MSDNDSEFEDFEIDASPPDDDDVAQMKEEEDDLVVASSPAHAAGDDDDEDEYDAPEEDAEEEQAAPPEKTPTAKDSGKKKAVASASAPAESRDPAGDKTDAKNLDEAYVMRNNVAYMVGLCPNHDGPGRVRDFGDVVVVEDDGILGTMHLPKNWPAAASFPPTAITVLKAKHTAEDELRPVEDEGPFAWYARVVTKLDVGKAARKNSNKKILKLIPKKVVQSLVKYLSEHKVYNRSSLIQKYQPAFENSKAFRVDINGWAKCPGIKGTGAAPKKEAPPSPVKTEAPVAAASDDEDLERETESAQPQEQGSPSAASKPVPKGKAPAPSPAAAEKKKSAAAPDAAPEPAKKAASMPRKVGMLNFAKSTKPVAEAAPAPAPAPGPVAPVEKTVSAPAAAASKVSAPQDKPIKPAAVKSSNEGASSSSAGHKRPLPADDSAPVASDVAFKRVRTLVVNDAEKSVTFWKGNTLYIAEL
tara:strand:- start:1002 stop:2423 length:1422 start_codon:yes stop_codon:yes gene_type:complete